MKSAMGNFGLTVCPNAKFEGFAAVIIAKEVAIGEDNISIGERMELKLGSEDMVQKHRIKLSTKKLIHFQGVQQKTVEKISCEEEEARENVIKVCKMGRGGKFVEKYYLDAGVANRQ